MQYLFYIFGIIYGLQSANQIATVILQKSTPVDDCAHRIGIFSAPYEYSSTNSKMLCSIAAKHSDY